MSDIRRLPKAQDERRDESASDEDALPVGKSHEAHFHGPVYGPVHAGSGDIHIDTLAISDKEQVVIAR